jgi:ABC-type antimicrobial peptide transport system permease subunit
VVSTQGPPEPALRAIAVVVHALDRDLPLHELRSMNAVVAASMLPWQGTTTGLVGLAALGMLLAALGLYGVLAQVMRARVAEIGVRRALGASGGAVAALVLRQAGGLIAAGFAGGLLVSLALGRLVERLLVGVDPLDPLTYLTVTALLAMAAGAAAAAPLLRALRVDPAQALRFE